MRAVFRMLRSCHTPACSFGSKGSIPNMIEQKFIDRIAAEAGARPEQVAAAVQLFDKGATVPFVAHYRKDVTGDLGEAILECVEERNVFYTAFTNRRNAILQNIAKQERLTDALRDTIMACCDTANLEDLYLPFRRRRRTRATVAIENRLGPLADYVWAQHSGEQSLESFSSQFIDPARSISSAEEALDGARAILCEQLAMDHETRAIIRERMWKEGKISTAATKNAAAQKTKFESYYNYSEPLSSIPSHRLLAALRGVKLGMLRMDLVLDDQQMLVDLVAKHVHNPGTVFEEQIRLVIEDAYRRHLRPELEKEVLEQAREKAEEEAICVFQENARNLLMAPPAGRIPVLGLQTEAGGTVAAAVVDAEGALRAHALLRMKEDADGTRQALRDLLDTHEVRAVAIGNGTGAHDTMRLIDTVLKQNEGRRAFAVYVNESGAAIYAASKTAKEELPDIETGVRAATSIARRLQDPLAELVKIEPRNIGVGQYQHDINQRRLRDGLYRTIVSCVNRVGADLNTASASLLRYVSGIQMGTAQNIVAQREKLGGFTNREQLLEIDGVGAKTYEQCSGFLRIRNGANPLDATVIHPEAYPVVTQIAAAQGLTVEQLIGNRDVLEPLEMNSFACDVVGVFTLIDIRQELLRPGRDPRRRFRAPRLLEGVYAMEDLQEGMETEGVVTNVTDFGAFIDIGIQQDGLVHLSELANRYVRDPRQVVKVGDIVRVKVIKVDRAAPRISLSIRAALPERPRKRRPGPHAHGEPQATEAAAAPQAEPVAGREGAEGSRGQPHGPRPERAEDRRPRPRQEGRDGGDRDTRARRDAQSRPHRDGDSRPRREGGDSRPPRRDHASDARRQGSRQGGPTEVKYGDTSGRGLNTQLADLLADLKKQMDG